MSVPDLTVRVDDNDIPRATVEPDRVTINEGDAAGGSYSFVLAGDQPRKQGGFPADDEGGVDAAVALGLQEFVQRVEVLDIPSALVELVFEEPAPLAAAIARVGSRGGYSMVG